MQRRNPKISTVMNEETLQQTAAPEAAAETPAAAAPLSAETSEPAEPQPAENPENNEPEPDATASTGAEPPAEEPQATAVPSPEPPDIDRLIAEAEHRGYMRGRNESIEQLMRPADAPADNSGEPDRRTEVLILNNLRESVWS